jgi:hypothetical protein
LRRYFIKHISVVFFVLLSLTTLTVFAGRLLPLSSQLAVLTLQHCELPCWIGIVPGQTTLGKAQQLLETAYPSPSYAHRLDYNHFVDVNWFRITRLKDGISFSVNFNEGEAAARQTKNTTISQITIASGPDSRLTLGDWSRPLGIPQALSLTWGSHWAAPNALYYRQGVRLTLVHDGKLNVEGWDVLADEVTIYADLHRYYPLNYTVPWQGWTSAYGDQLRALVVP